MSDTLGQPHALAASLHTRITDDENLRVAVGRVADAARRLLINCAAASVTLFERGQPMTGGSTSDVALALDQAQYDAAAGPCLTAATEDRVVLVADISDEQADGEATDGSWSRLPAGRHRARHPDFAVDAAVARLGRRRRPQHVRARAGGVQRRGRPPRGRLRRSGVGRGRQRPGLLVDVGGHPQPHRRARQPGRHRAGEGRAHRAGAGSATTTRSPSSGAARRRPTASSGRSPGRSSRMLAAAPASPDEHHYIADRMKRASGAGR